MPDDDPAHAEQLRLNLHQPPPPVNKTSATVVTFVDAETRAIRKEAIERVRNGGIFVPPDLSRVR
jgi:hypothetical protein